MYEVADALEGLPEDARIVRVVALSGFGSRHAGEALAVDAVGRPLAGGLLAGLVDDALVDAELFVQMRGSVPDEGWHALRDRRPVVLTTDLDSGATRVVTDAGASGPEIGDDSVARALLRSGRSTLDVTDRHMIESFLPPTTVRIVGRAGVGDALAAQAALLGWRHETVDGTDDAMTAAEAQASHDALVILSHDESVDTPALAAALAHGRGYVGALGSRATQTARRERLAAQGFTAEQLRTIHGPIGLDLGSRTPAETAVAIVAEIIAFRAGRDAAALSTGDGPING